MSLAGIFAVSDGEDAVGAIASAIALTPERTGAVFALSTWMGLAHLVVFVGASTAASVPLGFAGVIPWRLIVAADDFRDAGLFRIADWLYMARLAGYVCIAETPSALGRCHRRRFAAEDIPLPPLQTTIDRDELILSDVPNFAVEM